MRTSSLAIPNDATLNHVMWCDVMCVDVMWCDVVLDWVPKGAQSCFTGSLLIT